MADHSVLGTRWIYDAVDDPVWAQEMLRLVRCERVSEPGIKRGAGRAVARGVRFMTADVAAGESVIDLNRVIGPGPPAHGVGVMGVIMGSWDPQWAGVGSTPVTGCLAAVRIPHHLA